MWYIVGSILLVPTFLGTFNEPLFSTWSHNYSRGLQLFYYALLGTLFNVGWAAVQISNMSLVVGITYSQK